jgi:hypothetical protein
MKFKKANYLKWDKGEALQLWQVACLWADIEPPASVAEFRKDYLKHKGISEKYTMLMDAVASGELKSSHHQ